MSLFALPVSASDLTQLQQGIEFFTDTNEAATQVGLINAPTPTSTVYSYAALLLANNISLSQVVMAVDSLMFGQTDSVSELTKLSTQFLPAQVSHAVADDFNPTVYAAEALGLALAGGNGTSDAFATDFGSLSVTAFVSDVAELTGINSTAIQGFVQNWINFYTANPSATFGLSVTLASYGAAFGDAVGAALLNPNVNGTLSLLTSEVQNALIDNAEGSYQVGIPLSDEPAHMPLQGEAVQIPDAGGSPFGATIDWASAHFASFNYAQFVAPIQDGPLTINNAPSSFTLNTQHFAEGTVAINAGGGSGNLLTLILGDNTAGVRLEEASLDGYSTVQIVAQGPVGPGGDVINASDAPPAFVDNPPAGISNANLVLSGSGSLALGNNNSSPGDEGSVSVEFGSPHATITDNLPLLILGGTNADKIDASNAGPLIMDAPADNPVSGGVTVLGGLGDNALQGSLGLSVLTLTFSNGSTRVVATNYVGADNITGGTDGHDEIFGDGGPDVITLPTHLMPDNVIFGADGISSRAGNDVLAITNGSDVVNLGSWGATLTAMPTPVPNLFVGPVGGTSADMTTISGFNPGAGGDVLDFKAVAWNNQSTDSSGVALSGDLVDLSPQAPVLAGTSSMSEIWTSVNSNGLLSPSNNVLLYNPSSASLQDAKDLAVALNVTAPITLPNGVGPNVDAHILVAYAVNNAVNIADVDLVNTTMSAQTSTANLNVYASDMVHLIGVSLSSLTPDNIQFI
jgi:hypothetical protein